MEWQPISTAPKDGTVVLLSSHLFDDPKQPRFQWMGCYHQNAWLDCMDGIEEEPDFQHNWHYAPTHWMHLPEPPK